jgi:hypothetical protein
MLLNIVFEQLEVLLHVVSDQSMAIRSENSKKMRQLSNIKLYNGMVVEEPKVINSPHKQSVVLSEVEI